MLNTLDEKLKNRYGQDRFNPAAGQTQMTYEEWLDRHPALQRSDLTEKNKRSRYEDAVSAKGGYKYQQDNPDWATKQIDAPEDFTAGRRVMDESGKLIASTASYDPKPKRDLRGGLPGPDKPPASALRKAKVNAPKKNAPPKGKTGHASSSRTQRDPNRVPGAPPPRPAPFDPANVKPAGKDNPIVRVRAARRPNRPVGASAGNEDAARRAAEAYRKKAGL